MNSRLSIFVVDDAAPVRKVLEVTLAPLHDAETFCSGGECLSRLREKTPDLFLLDVEMPDMDGYELCRQIRAMPNLTRTPVIFVSALDDLESRLRGHDAGGDDFVVKPYKMAELKQKIDATRRAIPEQPSPAPAGERGESPADARQAIDRLAPALNASSRCSEISDAVFALFDALELDGVVHLRLPGLAWTRGPLGDNRPMDTAVIEHVRAMGAIFQFRTRLAYNHPAVTLLVNNLPTEAPERCTFLREQLAVAAEAVDARLRAISAAAETP